MSVSEHDRRYMERALELARGALFTSPNPRVGAVVVADGNIIGEGAHEGAGQPHAEAIALRGIDAHGATLYVTLEPCSHRGRTPPCVEAIVDAGIVRVVAPQADPDERVAGEGFAALAAAGVEVAVGILVDESERLNAAYLHHRRTGTSFVSLKLGLSLDGAVAAPDRSSRWITGPEARRHVHLRRAQVDAVMIGSGTVLADDPALTVRDVPASRQPERIVVDSSGRVPATARVFSSSAQASTLVVTTGRSRNDARKAWEDAGAEVLVLPEVERGVDLHALLKELGAREVLEVLCEGGARLATSLLSARLVQRLELHYGGVLIGRGGVRLDELGISTMNDAERWSLESLTRMGDDVVASLCPSPEIV